MTGSIKRALTMHGREKEKEKKKKDRRENRKLRKEK